MDKIDMLDVVYEDNHLLIVHKPANVLSQGDNTNDINMVTLAKDYLRKKYNKPGNIYIGLLHRLDRPVSGLIALAKTSKAAQRLSEQLAKKEMKRNYFAVVQGNMQNQNISDYLLQDSEGFVRVVPKGTAGAQFAQLQCTALAHKDNTTLVYVELQTGRKHQIRVQLQNIGHSILYDMRYGQGVKGKQIALFAASLELVHPTTKEAMLFTALPKIDSFKLYQTEIKEFLMELRKNHERNFSKTDI
ncbi:MAG: RluA family pseudouridine synthase [Eubacteriales bacterium]|nr:RluA family pseudouridine synthase [Eubacteriales bacterium]